MLKVICQSFGNKYCKKLIDTASKTGIDALKATSKRIVQKTAEAIGDLLVNRIADKITSIGKAKEKETKKEKINKNKFIFYQKKDNKLLMT